jgi:beta-glucosidase
MKEHKANAAKAKQGKDIIFLGDSITWLWRRNAPQVRKKFYGGRKAAHLGVSGDRTENLLWRIPKENILNVKPKIIVLMIGTNNIGHGHNGAMTAFGIRAIVKLLREQTPDTHIIVMGVPPRSIPFKKITFFRKQIPTCNEIVKGLASDSKVDYVDLRSNLTIDGVRLKPGYYFDGVHPTHPGYTEWAQAIEPIVSRILGDANRADGGNGEKKQTRKA